MRKSGGESVYVAKPDDIIQSSEIVIKAIENCLNGCPDMKADSTVQGSKKELIRDAMLIINKIRSLDTEKEYEDLLAEPHIIAKAVSRASLMLPSLPGQEEPAGS